MLRTRWLTMLFVLMFTTCILGQAGASVYAVTYEEITFADSNLESAVRAKLGISPNAPIMAEDLAGLTELYAHGKGITNLAGLEKATGLKTLKLHENQITDLTPLSSLTNLQTLYLKDNNITDLSPLSNLANLKTLLLRKNAITDISPLTNLTVLTVLDIAENSELYDINPLAAMQLQHLDISSTKIQDLAPITNMTSLTKLYLNGLELGSLDFISGLTSLKELEVLNNQLDDLTPLKGLTRLERLYAGHNNISDITPLTSLSKLHTLKLWYNKIDDPSPLLDLACLHKLYIKGNTFSLTPDSSATAVLATLVERGVKIDITLPSQPSSKSVTSVTLEPSKVTLAAGEYKKLTVTVLPADATNKSVTWYSDNPKVAKIENGKINAVAPGTAVIKVKTSDGGKIDTCVVTVITKDEPDPTIPVSGITLTHNNLELTPGEHFQLEATVVPADATDKTLVWTSNNTSTATVNNDGKVKAHAPGNATITVASKDSSQSTTCLITVSAPAVTDMAFKYTNFTLETGGEKKLPLIISPQGAWADYSWKSSNPEVATVDHQGNVKALSPGETSITVTSGTLSAACVLTVADSEDSSGIEYDLEQQKNTLSIPKELLENKGQLDIRQGKMQIVIPTQAWLAALSQLGLDSSESILVEIEEFEPEMTGKLLASGPAYSFTFQADEVLVSTFADKLLLTFNYDPDQVEDPKELSVYWYNPDTDSWDKLPSIVNTEEQTVSALINHWSSFALLQPDSSAPPSWWFYALFTGLGINAVLVVLWLIKRR